MQCLFYSLSFSPLRFIEYGEYKGNYYGTSLDSVHSVLSKNKVCLLDVQPHVSDTNPSSPSNCSPTVPPTLSPLFLALFSSHLSQKQNALFHSFPETLASYWVTKGGSEGGNFREQLLQISSIWRVPLWLVCLGWWRPGPTQMAGSSLSSDKALSPDSH